MELRNAAKFGYLISKDYAEDLLKLLVRYNDLSASEAASRLNLHIKTVQEYFEGMAELGILVKEEVHEKKRPYYRYRLKNEKIVIDIDLSLLKNEVPEGKMALRIRERKNSGVRFSTARYEEAIASIVIWSGEGRESKERKLTLTSVQGRFLYHLPFPGAEFLQINEIMDRAGVHESHVAEILDLVEQLEKYGVLDTS